MPTLILKDHRKSFRSWLDQGILNRRWSSERDKTGRQYEKSRTVSKDPSDPDLALREILAIVKDLKKIPSILRSWLATDMKTTENEKKDLRDSLNTSENPEVSNGILPILKDLKKKIPSTLRSWLGIAVKIFEKDLKQRMRQTKVE